MMKQQYTTNHLKILTISFVYSWLLTFIRIFTKIPFSSFTKIHTISISLVSYIFATNAQILFINKILMIT